LTPALQHRGSLITTAVTRLYTNLNTTSNSFSNLEQKKVGAMPSEVPARHASPTPSSIPPLAAPSPFRPPQHHHALTHNSRTHHFGTEAPCKAVIQKMLALPAVNAASCKAAIVKMCVPGAGSPPVAPPKAGYRNGRHRQRMGFI
jgi:hypothetical protein